jgi:aminoglycoside 3-N-acetyltransferase
VGIGLGDVVFSHVRLLGYPEEGDNTEAACSVTKDAFLEVLGAQGMWLVPTYSYSYCKKEIYDPDETPSDVGPFTNFFRQLPSVYRSLDPIFSVAGMGPGVEELLTGLPYDCFGPDCVYDRLLKRGGKICNIGINIRIITFIHYVEQIIGIPYRFNKLFVGQTRRQGVLENQKWNFSVRILAGNSIPDLHRMEDRALKSGQLRKARVGRGEINCISCRDVWEFCAEGIKEDPWFLASGPPLSEAELEELRV